MPRRFGVLPSFPSIWQERLNLYLSIFSCSLIELTKKRCSLYDENEISKMLCPILNRICFKESQKLKKSQKRDWEISPPAWENPIPPLTEKEMGNENIGKRPDFTCKVINPHATSGEDYEISLHIECKLLCNPTSKSWILNKKYVTNGIKRFDSKSHEYGKRASSGIMIGYIISMEPEKIADEVNKNIEKYIPHHPVLSFRFVNPPIFKENQYLNRKNVKPKSFRLIHLWVDLRI